MGYDRLTKDMVKLMGINSMNICAITYGRPTYEARTTASLSGFDNLVILRYENLSKIDFSNIDSDYVFFIKSGDALSEHAAQYLALNLAWQDADIFYSDEAFIYGKRHKRFNFYKPDYSPAMILSMNYFRNLLCIKTCLLKKIKQIDGVHNENILYEIVLKSLSIRKKIMHIDEVLYFNYSDKNQVDYQDFYAEFNQIEGRKSLENYCKYNQILGNVMNGRYHGTYRLKHAIQDEPLISIIIPFKDKPELLKVCVTSIIEKSTYKNFEIIGVNNSSKENVTLELMNELKERDVRIQFHDLNIPFNFSKINNYAVNNFAKGEHVVFLNNDTEIIEPTWIEAMLEHSQRPEVGVVGAKLLFPDHSIQHCGMLLGNLVLHALSYLSDSEPGYFYFPHIVRNYHAVTFACAMMKATLFKQAGELYEALGVACNDVDICARISALGYYNVYTPYAVLYHYESKSRGRDTTTEKNNREIWEREMAMQRTPALFLRDSFYNKHLNNHDADFSEKIRQDVKGLAILFFKRLQRRYREFGLTGMYKVIMNRFKKL